MKRIVLCADDYGQNTVISQAIIDLLSRNRLSATSCMTNADSWLEHAKWLKPFKDKADIGLHFNLTEKKLLGKELPTYPLNQLILKTYFRQVNPDAIERELHCQLDQFIKGMDCEPDFIDGHQHIQQFPVIRDVILKVYQQRLQKNHCYIRNIYNTQISNWLRNKTFIKNSMIQLTGAKTFI